MGEGQNEIKILVVDDEPTVADLLTAQLRIKGYRAVAAYSGKDGLEMAESGGFEIVVTDFQMDGIDGLNLISKLKQEKPSPIVIMITGYGNLELGEKAIRSGAYDFVEKPINFSKFQILIDRAIEHIKMQRRTRTAYKIALALFALIPVWIFLGMGFWRWYN